MKFMNLNTQYVKPQTTKKMIFRKFSKEIISLYTSQLEQPILPSILDSDDPDGTGELFINSFVSKLQTAMFVPENEIIIQGDPPQGIFFVSNGDCIVNIKNQNSKIHYLHRLLV